MIFKIISLCDIVSYYTVYVNKNMFIINLSTEKYQKNINEIKLDNYRILCYNYFTAFG